ncbi:MAG: hypothetical protein MJZ65_04075 [Paludibacteraceae bacterium]|nr:hypothetical protein [Paludibacteraceae bacterium]
MRRWIVIGIISCVAITASARLTSMIEVSVGGGWSSLGYQLNTEAQPFLTAKQAGSYGLTAHIGYGLMFTPHIGLGVGADIARYGADVKLGDQAQWLGVTDTDGELYDHITEVRSWKDQQQLYMVEIPLAVYFRAPASGSKFYFSGEVGAKVGIPVLSDAKYKGELSHQAGYEPWQLNLQQVGGHGFYDSTMDGKYDLSAKTSFAVFAKVGFETPLDEKEKVWFYGHLCGTYYVAPALSLTDTPTPLGFHNDSDNPVMQETHAFMADYTGILSTDMIKGKPTPISVGVELGVRFKIPHKQTFGCHCDRN